MQHNAGRRRHQELHLFGHLWKRRAWFCCICYKQLYIRSKFAPADPVQLSLITAESMNTPYLLCCGLCRTDTGEAWSTSKTMHATVVLSTSLRILYGRHRHGRWDESDQMVQSTTLHEYVWRCESAGTTHDRYWSLESWWIHFMAKTNAVVVSEPLQHL